MLGFQHLQYNHLTKQVRGLADTERALEQGEISRTFDAFRSFPVPGFDERTSQALLDALAWNGDQIDPDELREIYVGLIKMASTFGHNVNGVTSTNEALQVARFLEDRVPRDSELARAVLDAGKVMLDAHARQFVMAAEESDLEKRYAAVLSTSQLLKEIVNLVERFGAELSVPLSKPKELSESGAAAGERLRCLYEAGDVSGSVLAEALLLLSKSDQPVFEHADELMTLLTVNAEDITVSQARDIAMSALVTARERVSVAGSEATVGAMLQVALFAIQESDPEPCLTDGVRQVLQKIFHEALFGAAMLVPQRERPRLERLILQRAGIAAGAAALARLYDGNTIPTNAAAVSLLLNGSPDDGRLRLCSHFFSNAAS